MQSILSRLRRRRPAVIAALVFFTIFYYLTSASWDGTTSQLESVRLERYMNSNPPKNLKSKSSFDWSKVEFVYPPAKPLRQLPTARPISLPQVQHHFPPESPATAKIREARRAQVKQLFRKNWASYRKYAWMSDALQPLSAEGKDQFSGWAATLVDSLDTLWIMGLRDEFDEAVAAVASIDFGQAGGRSVNMFEVNIRYLGGLLAAYDLSGRQVLLQKATELGDLLYAGYNTRNRMPVDFIDFEGAQEGKGLMVESSVVSASPGTLSLEMTRLSQVTGDPKYYDAIAKVMDLFAKGQEWTKIPGLWPIYVSMSREDVITGSYFSIGGSADSLYEYIPKMYALLGGLEPKYEMMSKSFLRAADKAFFFRPMLPADDDLLMIGTASVDSNDTVHLDPESEHLGCFVGGIYALSGKLFRRPDWVDDLGAKLTKGCIYSYRAMPTGIGPERHNTAPCASREKCAWDEQTFNEEKKKRPEWSPHLPKGFTTVKDPRYILRPEAIESVFILYRITGKQEYQEAAWDMFTAVANGTATQYANAAVLDVTKGEYPLPQEDYMESFWLAETLKYFYLAFSPPDLISLDDYVLNTEAHPFRRPKAAMVNRPV
ncbi:family 47 glycosyl hydrolase [Apodospora peruviana]|uniref:alpha-1,2-Mannosidase n=1 Tax=Apodospora peruviana TaxID=516989 RepID=A0AAE0M0F6_9PEZI|nr:family 47 glycosyl hydrolase [Apodospora peruviana]